MKKCKKHPNELKKKILKIKKKKKIKIERKIW